MDFFHIRYPLVYLIKDSVKKSARELKEKNYYSSALLVSPVVMEPGQSPMAKLFPLATCTMMTRSELLSKPSRMPVCSDGDTFHHAVGMHLLFSS